MYFSWHISIYIICCVWFWYTSALNTWNTAGISTYIVKSVILFLDHIINGLTMTQDGISTSQNRLLTSKNFMSLFHFLWTLIAIFHTQSALTFTFHLTAPHLHLGQVDQAGLFPTLITIWQVWDLIAHGKNCNWYNWSMLQCLITGKELLPVYTWVKGSKHLDCPYL